MVVPIKGVAGLLVRLARLLYALLLSKLLWLLRQWRVYAAAGITIIASYCLAREPYEPGHL